MKKTRKPQEGDIWILDCDKHKQYYLLLEHVPDTYASPYEDELGIEPIVYFFHVMDLHEGKIYKEGIDPDAVYWRRVG